MQTAQVGSIQAALSIARELCSARVHLVVKGERPLNERRRHDVLENREWTPLAQGCTEQRTWAIVLWIGTAKVAHAFDKAMSERDHLIQDATSARAGLTGFNMHHALPLGIVLLIGLYALATLLFGQP